MFTLTIQVRDIEEAERVLAPLQGKTSPTPTTNQSQGNGVRFPVRRRRQLPKDLRQALARVQEKYGFADMTKPLAILAKFGVGKLDDLAPKDYPAFIAACEGA